jgi:hypothetical protein
MGQHKIIGKRECPCGRTFIVRTRAPQQKHCGHRCPVLRQERTVMATRARRRRREEAVRKNVRAAIQANGGKVTEELIVQIGRGEYDAGYAAGHVRGRELRDSRESDKAAA